MNLHESIESKLEKLPEYIKPEINDYLEFLLSKYGKIKHIESELNFSWEGKLSNLKNKYSSVELQHKAMDWR